MEHSIWRHNCDPSGEGVFKGKGQQFHLFVQGCCLQVVEAELPAKNSQKHSLTVGSKDTGQIGASVHNRLNFLVPIVSIVRILKFQTLKLPISPNLLIPILHYPLQFLATLCNSSWKVHKPYKPSRATLLIHFILLMKFLTFSPFKFTRHTWRGQWECRWWLEHVVIKVYDVTMWQRYSTNTKGMELWHHDPWWPQRSHSPCTETLKSSWASHSQQCRETAVRWRMGVKVWVLVCAEGE